MAVGLTIVGLFAAYVVALLWIRIASPRPTLGPDAAGHLKPCPSSPNCVWSEADDAGHHIEPFAFSGSAGAAVVKLKELLSATPGITVIEERPNYLRAECVTRLMRYLDDLEFAVDEGAGVIHVRTASRLGHSDLGANRARVERIRSAFAAGP